MDEERRKVQDMSLANRNAKAAMAALDHQNTKLHEFEVRINGIANSLAQMHGEFQQLKDMQMNDLIEKMGHGPTAE